VAAKAGSPAGVIARRSEWISIRIGQETQLPGDAGHSTSQEATVAGRNWQERFQTGCRQGDRVEREAAARQASSKTGKSAGSPEGDGRSNLWRTLETGGLGRRMKVGEGESKIHHRSGKCEGRYGEGWNAGGLPQA